MSSKGAKLGQELKATCLASPPWVVEFQCSGLKETDCEGFCEAAFKEAISCDVKKNTIPKASLVVGAGKLERQKYDDALPKWITSALTKIGFKEDQSASATLSSQGTFKFQHDTGQNLKFVHVFCRVVAASSSGDNDNDDADGAEESSMPLSGAARAEQLLLDSDLETFKKMITDKVGGFMVKKRVIGLLKSKVDAYGQVNRKLTLLQALTPEEQELFDKIDVDSCEKKIDFLKKALVQMVDENHISKQDRRFAVEHFEHRVEELVQQAAGGEILDKAKQRLATLKSDAAVDYRAPLKREDEIAKIWNRSVPLEALAEKAGPKGRWSSKLTPVEVEKLTEYETMMEDVNVLLAGARWWFEEEDEFRVRIDGAKKALVVVKKKGGGGNSGGGSSSGVKAPATATGGGGGGGFTTVSSKKPLAKPTTASSQSTKKSGNAFSALGGDDDSD